MKLVIHCGLHKTATTSFQTFCSDNRSALFDVGICYPRLGNKTQHSYLMHDVQETDIGILEEYLNRIYAEVDGVCHTVLLSGEDFENCIVDVGLAVDIEAAANRSGFESVTWVVVTRGLDELLRSLYAEMSKHGVTLRFDTLARSAAKSGCMYVSTQNYNYIFVLDYTRFEARFKENTSGGHIVLSYEDFTRDFVGMVLLKKLLSENKFFKFRKLAKFNTEIKNKRITAFQVEANYLSTALGVGRLRRRRYSFLLSPFIWLRRRKTLRPAGRLREE
jgi:hypothetical protein